MRPLLYDVAPSANWYAVYTFPKNERKVYEELSRKNIEAFLPTHTVIRQWSDRRKSLEVPLFPNYIFVKVADTLMWSVATIPGVVRYVTFDRKPAIIKQTDIDIVKKILKSGHRIFNEEECVVGEKVRIAEGAFEGFEGILISKKGSSRLCIELESMSKFITVEVPAEVIENVIEKEFAV